MSDAERRARLGRGIARTARLMDSAVRVPLLGIRVGLDALLGLLPGIGDAVGLSVSAGYLVAAARAGAPRIILVRMLGNIAVDFVAGLVPLAGDLFDVAWKANERNAALVLAWVESPAAEERAGRRRLVAIIAAALTLIAVAFAAGLWFVVWLIGAVLNTP